MDLVTGATGNVGGRLVPAPAALASSSPGVPTVTLSTVESMILARCDPGNLCWYARYPVHSAILGSPVRRVAERGRDPARAAPPRSAP